MRRIALSRVKMNALANYVYFAASLVLNFATTPLLLAGLGAAYFGIWRAILRFLDLATIVDARPTQALKWAIARRAHDEDDADRQRAIGSALIVWVIWIPVLVLILAALVWAVPHLMTDLSPEQIASAHLAVGILALNVVLGGLVGIPEAVLIGSGQGYRSINLNTFFYLVNSVALALAAYHGLGLAALAALTVASTVVNALFTWGVARRHTRWWGVRKPRRKEVSSFSRLSGWNLLWGAINQLMLSTEIFLFARLIGAEGVTRYSVTAYASQAMLMICMFTLSAIIPQLAALLGARRDAEASVMVRQSREIALALATFASCAILLLNGAFVSLWVGSAHYLGPVLNAWIVLASLQVALIRCDGQILDATMDLRGRALYGLAASLLSIGGAVLAFHFTRSIEASYMALIAVRLLQNISYALNVRRQVADAGYPWKRLLLALAIMAPCFIAGQRLTLNSWPQFLMGATLGAALLGIVIVAVMLPRDTLVRMGVMKGSAA